MPQTADYLITHARVLTQNLAQPRAEAVAVRGNRIAFVGSAGEAENFRGPAAVFGIAEQWHRPRGFLQGYCGRWGNQLHV